MSSNDQTDATAPKHPRLTSAPAATDRTYKEAAVQQLLTSPTFPVENAKQMTTALGAVALTIAGYYTSLIENGVPPDYAQVLTDKTHALLMDQVMKGAEQEIENQAMVRKMAAS